MTQIQSSVDALVKRIKGEEDFVDCTFVKGFSVLDCPNPLTGYMIAVSTLDTQVDAEFIGDSVGENLSGRMYNATVKFRLYAPKNDGGDGLSTLACSLMQAVRRCDIQNVCQDIKMSGIAFDSQAMTVYRDVVADLSFCMYEEVTQ